MYLKFIIIFILSVLVNLNVVSQTITTPTINKYANVLGLDYCTNTLSVPSGMGGQFSIGSKILLIQMKGASLNEENNAKNGAVLDYNNAGNYEVNEILSINSTATDDIVLKYEIERYYNTTGAVQIVNIPQYTDVTIQNTLTCQAWDGKTGGILIFNATGTVTMNANIDVSAKGFRGGDGTTVIPTTSCYTLTNGFPNYNCEVADLCGGRKGEGVGSRFESEELGRGRNANGGGGGNDHNAGGGGGGAFAKGGRGGDRTNGTCFGYGALGGDSLNLSNVDNKILSSGGGGAGHANNGGTNSYVGTTGGNAGATVIISGNSIKSNGNKIISNGGSVGVSVDDGAGGGGGGGLIILNINNFEGVIDIESTGGKGGDVSAGTSCAGPGGGGSGGTVWLKNNDISPMLNLNALGGDTGIVILNACSGDDFNEIGENGGYSNDFFMKIDNIVFQKTTLNAGKDTIVCGNTGAPLWAEFNSSKKINFVWNWSTGSENELSFNFKPEFGGNYNVVASASFEAFGQFCEETYLVNVDIRNPNIIINASSFYGDTVTIGEPIFVNAVVQPFNADYVYSWSPSDKVEPNDNRNAVALPHETNSFCLTVTDELSCANTKCIDLYVYEPKVISANAFSPNGDGLNDVFIPILTEDLSVVSFTVYDRWGAIVYHTKDATPWNAIKNGKELSSDMYLWSIEVIQDISNKVFKVMGDVSIVR